MERKADLDRNLFWLRKAGRPPVQPAGKQAAGPEVGSFLEETLGSGPQAPSEC